ncbi:hypothetical protein [Erwinia persicina]|uniref:Uncharacterized protein n=1 Tax=Erwinia persicina TaxID=55211 RepID=A0ABR9A0I0_9GAMM|nr:hypothetical protein [Erwinia persicina]MBD8109487.1 hypothetical protein [Erwinia persicina]MBD8212630.1 hypothetical protein [Erwinia persicina]
MRIFFRLMAGWLTATRQNVLTSSEIFNVLYGLSAAAGIWLAFAVVTAVPVTGTFLAVAILIGTAIYLAFQNRDSIQKWLIQCLWRRIPVDTDYAKEKQEKYMKAEAAELPVWPTMEMEMDELKLALGVGG